MLGFAEFTLDVLLGLNNNQRYQNLTAVISKRSAYPAIRVKKSEQAGCPRSSCPENMKTGMIRQCEVENTNG